MPAKKKIDYIGDIFDHLRSTQTIIFANSRKFCETTWHVLKDKRGQAAHIIFGAMTPEERDEYIEKFRKLEIQVIVATDMLSRGFDVPEL